MSNLDKTPQHAILHLCYKLGKSPLETLETVNKTYGHKTVKRRLVYRWYQRFRDGDESLQDHNRTGRPVESRTDLTDNQVAYAIVIDHISTILVRETRSYLRNCYSLSEFLQKTYRCVSFSFFSVWYANVFHK